jgi:hypothetical protein
MRMCRPSSPTPLFLLIIMACFATCRSPSAIKTFEKRTARSGDVIARPLLQDARHTGASRFDSLVDPDPTTKGKPGRPRKDAEGRRSNQVPAKPQKRDNATPPSAGRTPLRPLSFKLTIPEGDSDASDSDASDSNDQSTPLVTWEKPSTAASSATPTQRRVSPRKRIHPSRAFEGAKRMRLQLNGKTFSQEIQLWRQ